MTKGGRPGAADQAPLHLAVQYACDDPGPPSRPQVRRWVRAAAPGGGEFTVRFVGEAEGRALNRDFRDRDYATNVLSFPYADDPPAGDLVVCLPVVDREARAQRKALRDHFAHMIVHGILHLQGYDHETGPEDAERMEAREREILAAFRIADPY
ncbi:MAG: rRNA maturation RNase YbeY [Rhodocyclaceae bacterium]|nr:rRNA maturation RNase YbeY [Rhodocyclaceae bacterium]